MVEFLAMTKELSFIRVKGTRINVEGFPKQHTLVGHKSVNSGDSHPFTITHLESGTAFCKVKKKKNAKRAIRKKMETYGNGSKLKRTLDKARKRFEQERWKPKYIRQYK